MSGHSKWAGIKHKKAIVDAKKGQTFTKVARELTIAAREGGGDINGNFRLRLAVQKAREVNMPADNIQRSIERGTGGGKDAAQLEEIRYEGYGPGGVAVMVDTLTDNRNRTVAYIRTSFSRAGGSLGESNSVAWMFTQRGIIRVNPLKRDPDELALEVLEKVDLGDDGDVTVEDGEVLIQVAPTKFEGAKKACEDAKLVLESAEVTMHPTQEVPLDDTHSRAVLNLLTSLEEDDDVQQVYTNAQFSESVLEAEA